MIPFNSYFSNCWLFQPPTKDVSFPWIFSYVSGKRSPYHRPQWPCRCQGPESNWGTDFGTPWWEDTSLGDKSGQSVATSHDRFPPECSWSFGKSPLFQGNLGWWKSIIWPDRCDLAKFKPKWAMNKKGYPGCLGYFLGGWHTTQL